MRILSRRGASKLKTLGSGESLGRKGRRQAMSLLGFLDGKTLKHARTTWAENGGR